MAGMKLEVVGEDSLEHASVEAVLARLDVTAERGLSAAEAAKRLAEHGPNTIECREPNRLLQLLAYFWGPIPWMLEVACVLSGIAGRWDELAVIFGMLVINGGVSWWHESSAAKAIAALADQLAPEARVIRDGVRATIEARTLVPGDVIVVRRGDVVPADASLLGDELSVDESALSGESLPIDKGRGDAVYSSTVIARGEARAVVIATGRATRFGRTVELVEGVADRSHFQQAVIRIGDFLMAGTGVLVLVVAVAGVIRGQGVMDVLLFALILTVAGIPVALPAVLSVAMAVGARRLAASRAIVSRLAAMEELAGVKVLFSDKTGTLTENRLALQDPVLIDAADRDELVLSAALTADRSAERDPIDDAILAAADREALAAFTVEHLELFDSTRKRADARVSRDGRVFDVTKGAPQVVLELCGAGGEVHDRVSSEVERLGCAGFRALGVARRDGERWRYLGLLSLLDPPRTDSTEVIAEARAHGVDVRMVTGDHVAIARQVAGQLGMGTNIEIAGPWLRDDAAAARARAFAADGFAEVTPEDKYHLVAQFQSKGLIVGMTGDGVNDAPALEKADVGFAVASATDAARASADIVLTTPGLGVIIGAIDEARRIFERMLSYATYRIAETIRMVVFVAGAIAILGVYPVTAIMVALLAILNDIPIMTIATDNARTARAPVRWDMRWVLVDATILGVVGVIGSALLLWFAIARLELSGATLQTFVFLKLLVAGHLTLYVVRVRDWFWRRPWPSWKLLVALELTQVLGTLVAVYGWLVTPIGWELAGVVWAYAVIWMFLLGAIRVLAFRVVRPRLAARPEPPARREPDPPVEVHEPVAIAH